MLRSCVRKSNISDPSNFDDGIDPAKGGIIQGGFHDLYWCRMNKPNKRGYDI